MRVEDLGSGPVVQGANSDTSLAATNPKQLRFFNFITLLQLNSEKIRFFSAFATFFQIFQNVFISFWPHLNLKTNTIINQFEYIRTPPQYEEYLTHIFFLFSTTHSTDILYAFSFVINLVTLLFFFISLVSFILYYFKSIINFPLILCFNIFARFICPIVTAPLGFQTGWLISKVIYLQNLEEEEFDDPIQIYILIIVLNMIAFIIVIIITYYTNAFNTRSILIVDTHAVPFNGKFKSCLMLIPSILLLLSNLLPLFHKYFVHFTIILHVIFCVCMTAWCFWLPFGKIRMNSFVASLSISMIVSDFLCYTSLRLKWYRYLIFLGCFVVFFIVMSISIKFRIRKILKSTNETEKVNEDFNEEFTENEKSKATPRSRHNSARNQIFGDPNGEVSAFEDLPISKILFILRTAMITHDKLFVEGKLLDLIGTKLTNDQDKIELACLICHFPDFQPFFFALLMGLKRSRFIPFIREYQLFQLRCFELSCHPDSKVEEVEGIIHESRSLSIYLRSKWQVIESECESMKEKNIDEDDESKKKRAEQIETKNVKIKKNMFSTFDRLSRSIYNCQSKWKAIISFYPNNIQIAEEYTNFLIECCGDFMSASEWKTISILLQEGKTHKFNPATVSFLRSFPYYVRQIYPKRTMMKGFDDIDDHNKIENISKLIDMPEARLEFQRSTNSSYPISMYVFLVISLISLVYIIVFWIEGICTFHHFEHMTESMHFISNVGLLSQQISKNFINAVFDYGQLESVGVAPTSDEIFNTLYIDNFSDRLDGRDVKSLVVLNGEYKSQLAKTSENGMNLINFLHRATLEQTEKGNNFQVVLNTFYDNTRLSTYYLSRDESISSTSNLQSLLISYFTYYFTMSYDENFSYIDDPNCYHASMAGAQVLERIDLISQSILQNNEILLKDYDFVYSTKLYIIGSIYIVISIICIWVDVIFIIKKFTSIVNSLCYFPKEAILRASKSMVTVYDDSGEINVRSCIKNFVFISLVVSTIINIIISGLIFGFHFIYSSYKNNFESLTELIHYYSLETSQVVEVLYSVMAASTFGRIIPAVDQKYKGRLTANLGKIIKTHQSCWSYSVRGDCGVSDERVRIINQLKNQEKCPDWPDKTYHELYGCLSEESGFNLFVDLTISLISMIDNPDLLKNETFIQYIHFTLSHLYYDVSQFTTFLQSAADDKELDYIKHIKTFGAISIVISLMVACLNVFIYIKIRGIYKILYGFISRILPSDLVMNNQLLNALLGIKSTNKDHIENTGTSFLVQESATPIIFIDRSGLIEFVNRAFSSKFSYESNFIVGQPISVIIKDEESLYFIDTLKFFESRKTAVRTILCEKGNGNRISFDITFIPIHNASKEKQKLFIKKMKDESKDPNQFDDDEDDNDNKSTFVNRVALVFIEKTSEKNLEKKCNIMKLHTQKIYDQVFPPVINLCTEGYMKVCSICLIKLPNTFQRDTPSSRLLQQRQNIYDMLYEKLQIFPLLLPLDSRNGIFATVGCKKNDPTELAIECLNFAFTVLEDLNSLHSKQLSSFSTGMKFTGTFFAVVETGDELVVKWTGGTTNKAIYSGELVERALQVLDNASSAGNICISKKTYEYIMHHDYNFIAKEISEEINGCNYIYAVENPQNYGSSRYSNKSFGENGSENESNNYSANSSSLVEKLKEEFFASDD